MSSLTEVINKGHKKVEVTRFVDPFDVKEGPIPYIVPVLRKEGRIFAGGKIILKERLDALLSKNEERIQTWGHKHYNFADACLTFEDLVKLQPDSPLLTAIRGVVETSDGPYVAVDAEAVSAATNGNMNYFEVSSSETVIYGLRSETKSEIAQNVALLKYDPFFELTADQFNSVKAKRINRNRSDIVYEKDILAKGIVRDGKVIHPAWKIYPAEIIIPLVEGIFRYNRAKYNYHNNMGFFLPPEPQNCAEMRTLCVGELSDRSRLHSSGVLDCLGRLVGVVDKAD